MERAAARGCWRRASGCARGRDASWRAEDVTSGKEILEGRVLEPENEAHVEGPGERADLRHGGSEKGLGKGRRPRALWRGSRVRAHDPRVDAQRGCRTRRVVVPMPVGLGDSCAKCFRRERNEAVREPFALPPFATASWRASTGGGRTRTMPTCRPRSCPDGTALPSERPAAGSRLPRLGARVGGSWAAGASVVKSALAAGRTASKVQVGENEGQGRMGR